MKNLTDRTAVTSNLPAQQPIDNLVTAADNSTSATPPHLLRHPAVRTDSPIRIPAGVENIFDIFHKPNLYTLAHGASRHFLNIMQDMAARGVRPAAENFAHTESWWRENARAIAADGTRTTPGVKITAKNVLAAFDRGTTGSPAKDGAVDAAMQSLFARAAETYLIEASAPSPEMRGVLEQFRDWLLSIYRRLVALDISLAPDIAAIFFRLLACDTAIEMAQQDVGGEVPVFADAQAAGLPQAQYDRLLKLRALAAQEAKTRLLRQMMEPVRREDEKAYREEKAAAQRAVEEEINATSLYRAIEWMANRRWLNAETPAPASNIRFDKAALVSRYGAAILDALPQGKHPLYAENGGLDPDIVADLFGLGSGDELVAAMTLAPPRADAIGFEVERLMLQRHGDMLIDGSAEERAIAAVHNDRRAEWLAAELASLIEVAGTGDGLTASEAKAYALSATAGMEVGDAMDGARFLAAGRRTGMEAVRLGDELAQDEVWRDRVSRRAAGDANTAPHPGEDERIGKLITAKRRQLLNHAIYAESLEIIKEVERSEAEAESLANGPAREKLTEAVLHDDGRIDYPGAIDALLDRYGLSERANGQARGQIRGQDDPRMALRNYILAMKEAGRGNELAIPDSVLIGSGRQSYKEITLERFRALAAALKNVEHAAGRAGKLIHADDLADLNETASGLIQALKRPRPDAPVKRERPPLDPARAADGLLQEIDATVSGPAYRAIKAPLDAAASRLALSKQKSAADLQALYDAYSAEEISEMGQRRYLPALGQSLSKWEAIAIALNSGNEANRRRLTDSRVEGALDEAGLDAVLASLSERDAGFVQSVWDYLAAFQPDIAARQKRLTGIEPQWVMPIPVTIAGKALKGGYYPLAYDAADASPDLSQALMAGGFARSATGAGHGRARADLTPRPLDLDIAVLHRHVNHLLYDLEFSEPLSNARRLLNEPSLRAAFGDTGRTADWQTLQAWLTETAAGDLSAADLIGRTTHLAKKNLTAVSLATDLAAALCSQARLAETIIATGRADFASGLQSAFRPGILDDIVSRSPVMAKRQRSLVENDRDRTAWETMACWLAETLQYRFVEVPAWLSAYQSGLRQSGGDEAKAIAHADKGMAQRVSTPHLPQKNQSEILRLFTALGSHLSAKFKSAAEGNTDSSADAGEAPAAQQGISLAMDLAALAMMDTVFAATLEGRQPAGDTAWAASLAQQTGYSIIAALPAIRDAPLSDGSDARTLANVIRAPSGDIGINERHRADIIAATGLAAGLPADKIARKVDAGLARIAQP